MGATINDEGNDESFLLSHPWSASKLDRLKMLLLQTAVDLNAIALNEEALLSPSSIQFPPQLFVVVASPQFSALLQATLVDPDAGSDKSLQTERLYQVSLTVQPEPIAAFLDDRRPQVRSDLQPQWSEARSHLQPNKMRQQSGFTRLLDLLLDASTSTNVSEQTNQSSCEIALQQQVEQERSLNQLAAQIHQSLELPIILQAAVDRARECLQVDRLVIYQIERPPIAATALAPASDDSSEAEIPEAETLESDCGGSVIYEARASETIPAVLHFSDAHCFVDSLRGQMRHPWKFPLVVEDVAARYKNAVPCLLDFLQRAQVQAKLVAPIWVHDRLWGMLIAHDCTAPHQWQASEQQFLQQVAQHLAIAIQQAQLYSELQQQKQTLEQRVIERTQALQDSMLAAQAASRTKSEFLAAVSHEFRTPLACIIGMSTTLQRWTADSLDERQRHFLQMIHDSGEQLLNQVEDMLALSQAEAGKTVLNLREVSLSLLAQQMFKMLESQAAQQQIVLELDLHLFPQNDRLMIDPQRVRQILFNLLSNAIKFTPVGGTVTLRAFVEKNLVTLQVKDTGIGIPEHLVTQLFQKFHQLDRGYGRQYQGTGLGLALTKQLVELHGGWIDVESTVGVGSVFTVWLPVLRSTEAGLAIVPPPPDSPKGRIILIEHREDIAEVICDSLTAAGYQLVWMLEGATAVAQIEVMRPAVVIADVDLPDIKGETLIEELRRNPGTKQIKIVALASQTAEREDWQAIGADDLLHHPITPERLLRMIVLATEPASTQ